MRCARAASTMRNATASVRAPLEGPMAQHTGPASSNDQARGKLDTVSILYVIGGIPAILGFLVLIFAVGVRGCGIPA